MRSFIAALLIAATSTGVYYQAPVVKANSRKEKNHRTFQARTDKQLMPVYEVGSFITYMENGERVCRQATAEEALALNERDPNQTLRVITPIRPNVEGNIKIVLRATSQLEKFPEAKAAFLKAAATWEERIATPITVVVDVDFGTTRFGKPYQQGVLGATATQTLGADNIYEEVRKALFEESSNEQEAALYQALPKDRIPTTLGDTAFMVSPSAQFRALGFIEPIADPDKEKENFGAPPSIGFNSNFKFDFDPSNGIDSGAIDFDATAVHEIGHALGFASSTGLKELVADANIAPTIWDLFRVKKGTTRAQLATAERMLTSGGEQIFFATNGEILLSTGRPDGSGGDGAQASHWKASNLAGGKIGIMDPFLSQGVRDTITKNDMVAIDMFGYRLAGQNNDSIAPEVTVTAPNGGARLNSGGQFNITWTSTDNISVARHNAALSTDGGATFPVTVANGLTGSTQNFLWTIPDVETTQGQIRVTAIDAAGNEASNTSANFAIVKGPVSADFNILVSPASQNVNAGAASSYTVNMQALGGFSQSVALNAAVTPNDGNVSLSLSNTTVAANGNVTLTANAVAGAPNQSYSITLTGTAGQITRTATATLNVVSATPDFSLGFSQPTITVARKARGQFTVNINRTAGFAGNVTVTAPDTKAAKIKLGTSVLSTTGTSVSFDFKVKKGAPIGTQQLTFTAVDEQGRTRTATLTVVVTN